MESVILVPGSVRKELTRFPTSSEETVESEELVIDRILIKEGVPPPFGCCFGPAPPIQSAGVNVIDGIVSCVGIDIDATLITDGVTGEEAGSGRIVVTHPQQGQRRTNGEIGDSH